MTDQTERENLDRDTRIFLGAHSARAGNDSGMIEAVSLLHRWQSRAALDGGAVSQTTDEEWTAFQYKLHAEIGSLPLIQEINRMFRKRDALRTPPQRDGGAVSQIRDAAENVVIAYGMDWDMDGVIEVLRAALRAPQQPSKLFCDRCDDNDGCREHGCQRPQQQPSSEREQVAKLITDEVLTAARKAYIEHEKAHPWRMRAAIMAALLSVRQEMKE